MPSLRVLSSAAALLVACSGASESPLFGSNGTPSAPVADASTPAADASNGGGPDASPPPPVHDSGGPPVQPDASHPPPPPDASTGDPGVLCGSTSCDPRTAVCCRVDSTGKGNFTDTCTPAAACAAGAALPIPCDDAQDCITAGAPAGSICCVTADPQTGHATGVACVQASDCNAQTQTWLCDPNAPDGCPQGETCSASKQTISGYDICH
jgi:hypothetical protein